MKSVLITFNNGKTIEYSLEGKIFFRREHIDFVSVYLHRDGTIKYKKEILIPLISIQEINILL